MRAAGVLPVEDGLKGLSFREREVDVQPRGQWCLFTCMVIHTFLL